MTSHVFRTCLETQNRPNYWYARRFFGWCSLRQRNWRLNSGLKSATIVTDPLQVWIFIETHKLVCGTGESKCNLSNFLPKCQQWTQSGDKWLQISHYLEILGKSSTKCNDLQSAWCKHSPNGYKKTGQKWWLSPFSCHQPCLLQGWILIKHGRHGVLIVWSLQMLYFCKIHHREDPLGGKSRWQITRVRRVLRTQTSPLTTIAM